MFLALLRNDHCSFQQPFLRHFRCRRHKNCYSPKVRSGAHYAHAVVNLRDSAAVYEILIRKNDPNCARRGRKMREQSAKNKWLLASCLFCVRCATRWHASKRVNVHPIRTSVYEAGVLLPGLDGCRAARWKKLLETNAHSGALWLRAICTEWAINMKERRASEWERGVKSGPVCFLRCS
jgi:hypothetical protein